MDIPEFHHRFLSEAPDGILFSDREGFIRFWNAGCERIFGYAESEAIGQSLDIIIPEALRARHWQGYAQTMASGKSRYAAGDVLAVPALHKDKRRISVEFSITPFRDAAGEMIGLGAVVRDVTSRFEELKALRKAAAHAGDPAAPAKDGR
jgi:PAS domain S-box-containing protein